MKKMRAMQFARADGTLESVQRDIPEASPGLVRVKVQACGICHSDVVAWKGAMPGVRYPIIPGHEIAGVIDAVGPGVAGWKVGQRVGVGWNGGYCGYCDSCRRGNFFACETITRIPGITYDGGYADYMLVLPSGLARIPDGLTATEAAPLMCAGVTTFNALRHSGARMGDRVAILGVGGLGHLAIQFAARMGFETIAVGRGRDKEALSRELGARHYIDNKAQDPAAELRKLGRAGVILATATDSAAMTAVLDGLSPGGTLLLIGLGGPLQVAPEALILTSRSIQGWYSGTAIDSQDTLSFSALNGVRSRNEVFPLELAAEAFQRMLSGAARFRVVLTTGND